MNAKIYGMLEERAQPMRYRGTPMTGHTQLQWPTFDCDSARNEQTTADAERGLQAEFATQAE